MSSFHFSIGSWISIACSEEACYKIIFNKVFFHLSKVRSFFPKIAAWFFNGRLRKSLAELSCCRIWLSNSAEQPGGWRMLLFSKHCWWNFTFEFLWNETLKESSTVALFNLPRRKRWWLGESRLSGCHYLFAPIFWKGSRDIWMVFC